MKVYTNIVYDKDDNIIEEHSYNYKGPVSQARGHGTAKYKASLEKAKILPDNLTRYQTHKKVYVEGTGVGRSKAMSGHYEWVPIDNTIYKQKHFDPSQGNTVSNRKTKTKEDKDNRIYVTDISDPNQLWQYASYNTLFTLSALTQDELEMTKGLPTAPPHDIVMRSSGIGPNENQTSGDEIWGGKVGPAPRTGDQKAMDASPRKAKTLNKSRIEFKKNNDLYFKNVTMINIPGYNEKTRLTSTTTMEMEIVEPYGITLIRRLQAAAANNGYLDHVDAPFMLTIEFVGWDEQGQPIPAGISKNLKRIIPIKLTKIGINLNQSGAIYSVKAVAYNEFAFANRYNNTRSAGTLEPKNRTLSSVVVELTEMLNKQNMDEKPLVSIPDKYEISINSFFKPDTTVIDYNSISQSPMYTQSKTTFNKSYNPSAPGGVVTHTDVTVNKSYNPSAGGVVTHEPKLEFMSFDEKASITKILEDLMKAHPDMTADRFKEWKSKVEKEADTFDTSNPNEMKDKTQMHFWYFRIRSSVVPIRGLFDPKRQENVKKIKYVVEPYKVHAYSLAIPGVSTGQNYKHFVYKTYNYLFTGENVDILDLDIQYNIAYYQSKIKDVDPIANRATKIRHLHETSNDTGTDSEDRVEDGLNLKSYPSVAGSQSVDVNGIKYTFLDQFMDALTHPLADMVRIEMEILGDPAWFGQSQFLPAVPTEIAPGVSQDLDIAHHRGGSIDQIWNPKLRCFNTDVAEPIIMLNFKMPTDINDRLGTYEMSTEQQLAFNGLYRVIRVEHRWNNGKYTNLLKMTRFNNQGVFISSPTKEKNIVDTTTGESFVTVASPASGSWGPMDFLQKGKDGLGRITSGFINNWASKVTNGVIKAGFETFNPAQGSKAKLFHPRQGGPHSSNGGTVNQEAVYKGIQASEDDI